MNGAQRGSERELVEQLGLGQVPHPTTASIRQPREGEWVEVRDVIARKDRGTLARDALATLDGPLQPPSQAGIERSLGQGVEGFHGR